MEESINPRISSAPIERIYDNRRDQYKLYKLLIVFGDRYWRPRREWSKHTKESDLTQHTLRWYTDWQWTAHREGSPRNGHVRSSSYFREGDELYHKERRSNLKSPGRIDNSSSCHAGTSCLEQTHDCVSTRGNLQYSKNDNSTTVRQRHKSRAVGAHNAHSCFRNSVNCKFYEVVEDRRIFFTMQLTCELIDLLWTEKNVIFQRFLSMISPVLLSAILEYPQSQVRVVVISLTCGSDFRYVWSASC